MKGRIDSRNKWITAALLGCLLGASAATAQGPGVLDKGTVSAVKIAVWDPDNKDELAELESGDTLQLNPGDTVMLRAFVPRGSAPGNQRWYLSARFTVAQGGGGEIHDADTAKGSAQLTASTTKRVADIRYELVGKGIEVTKPYLARGSFRLEVRGPAIADPPRAPQRVEAEAMVKKLYAGILLRDYNAGNPAGQKWVGLIQREGYPGVVEASYEIVISEESRVKVPARGASHNDRLLALYKHLLDVDADEVDRYQWRDHLAMMTSGNVVGVVMDIVRSPEFRRVHGYN